MGYRLGLIGEKIGMTRIFDADGNVVPVTVIKAGPCPIVQIKTEKKDGYNALRIAYKEVKETKLNRPELGTFKKVNISPHKIIREIRLEKIDGYKVGDVLNVEIFKEGGYVDITGITKGKGFQGVVKRWGFTGGPKTRGQSDRHRAPGAIGMCADPSRVWKNKRMPGRMGFEKKTVQNLKVIKIDKEKNLVIVKGSVPGTKNSIVIIKQAVKKQ